VRNPRAVTVTDDMEKVQAETKHRIKSALVWIRLARQDYLAATPKEPDVEKRFARAIAALESVQKIIEGEV
jgi:hypothetical protein